MLDVEGLRLTEADVRRLGHPLVGGVILFARNYESREQVGALIDDIKAIRSPALLVAVDQEGGRVQRFKNGFTELPAASTFGDAWEKDKQRAPIEAYQSARLMAAELISVGVDFSFAPVFDVNSVENDVIGDRCFHPDPNVATELLAAYIDGMHSQRMPIVAKHFPGHGGVGGDSHVCLPSDSRALESIRAHDMVPYRALMDDIDAVMTAHVLFERCDSSIPTYSEFWLQTVLREQMGFDGVVFSDDLAMQGAIDSSADDTIVVRAQTALKAGCDMLLLCNRPDLCDELLEGLAFMPSERLSARLRRLSVSTD